jgi:hypothetical protein
MKDLDLSWMWIAQHNELIRLLESIEKTKSNADKINFIRTFFCLVESISYKIRQILLDRYKTDNKLFSPIEYVAMSEKDINIEINGEIKTKEKFYKFENFFRFTLKTYSAIYNKKIVYDTHISKNGYECFKNVIKIRNRITHPKNSRELFVTDEELIETEKARKWFHHFITDLLTGDLINNQEKAHI